MKAIKYLILTVLLTACSANQVKLQNHLIVSNDPALFELKEGITIKAVNAKPTILKAYTKWTKAGLINQGEVFRTKDQVVIVNSFDVHEGYIVVEKSQVVGYYLPVEKTFVETEPVRINLSIMELKNEI